MYHLQFTVLSHGAAAWSGRRFWDQMHSTRCLCRKGLSGVTFGQPVAEKRHCLFDWTEPRMRLAFALSGTTPTLRLELIGGQQVIGHGRRRRIYGFAGLRMHGGIARELMGRRPTHDRSRQAHRDH